MKIATASYLFDVLPNWVAYTTKLIMWVDAAARHGAALLVFPVFGVMELAALAGPEVANDLEASLHAVAARIADANALHADLAQMQGGACSGWLRPCN